MSKPLKPVAIRRPWGFERFIKQQGFHGIYLVTTERGAPVKVGITENPVSRFGQLQSDNFVLLRFHRFWWLPGRPVSKKIESEFKSHFEPQNIRGEWFDTPLDEAEALIEDSVRRIGTWAIKQVHMLELMEDRERRRFSLPQ